MEHRKTNWVFSFRSPTVYVSGSPRNIRRRLPFYCTNLKLKAFLAVCIAWCLYCGHVAFSARREQSVMKGSNSVLVYSRQRSQSFNGTINRKYDQRKLKAWAAARTNSTKATKLAGNKKNNTQMTINVTKTMQSKKNNRAHNMTATQKNNTQTIVNVTKTMKSKKNNRAHNMTATKKAQKKRNVYRIKYRVGISKLRKNLRNDTIYIIMPTYARQIQRPLLIMQAQVFAQVPNMHVIVAEDSLHPTQAVKEIMQEYKLNFTQVACTLPTTCGNTTEVCLSRKNVSGRGVIVRNCALQWLQNSRIKDGVIYFADDDNFYQLKLFTELRKTRKVALFPVGGFEGTWFSSILVKDGKISDFTDIWKGNRKWPIDMSGFSVSINYWRKMKCPKFVFTAGYLETKFLGALNVTRDDIDVLGENATKVYVWHNSIRRSKCMKPADYKKLKKLEKENFDNYKSLTKDLIICK